MKKEYYRLKLKREITEDKMKELIIRAIRENGGRITLQIDEDEENPFFVIYQLYETNRNY